MKYAKIENYIIVQIQPYKEKNFIEVNENVVCGMIQKEDGSFVNPVFKKTAEEIEEERKQNINSYTQSFITKKYPLEKQSSANLGIYGDDYKNEMISFISNCINLSNEAIDNGISLEDYKAMLNANKI